MSIIGAIREWLMSCPFLDEFSGGSHIDYTDDASYDQYGVFPTGQTRLTVDAAGSVRWQYNFSLQAAGFTAEDAERLQNQEFIERFCDWVQEQNFTLPDLGEGIDAESMTAQNGQFVDIAEDGQTGTYQILCSLIYEKERTE